MSPSTAREASTRSATAQRLLEAALAVLQRDGAPGLTVRNIADEAGCSTTGIYTYFGGKQGLVEAIFTDGFDSFDRALAPAYEARDLLGAGLAYRRWALANTTHYLVMFGRAVPDFVPGDDAMVRAARSFEALSALVGDLIEGIEPEAAAYHLYATVHGYVMLELVGMGPPPNGTDPPDPDALSDPDALYEAGLRHTVAGLLSG